MPIYFLVSIGVFLSVEFCFALKIYLKGAPFYNASASGKSSQKSLRRELMLFGIDVVIIEPGTVNTAMYDKGEKEDLSEFKQTEYWEAVQKFQKFIVNEGRNNGLSPERLGEAVHVALRTAKPKARYAVVPQRFKNWTLPRLLPARMVDAQLAKLLGLTKATQRRPPFMKSTNPANWILVTGTSSGIGRAATFTLAENGYRVLAAVRTARRCRIAPGRGRYAPSCGSRRAAHSG